MLKINNLTVSYDNKVAIDNVSMEFCKGKITGLIGPNGAGKSTLLKTCIGLLSAYSGDIWFENRNLKKERFWVKQNATYASENAELLSYLTGQEFLTLIARIYKLDSIEESVDYYINLMGLEQKKDDLITNYSHGMKQKLSAAAALLPNPKYIFLDESLNGLDIPSLSHIFEYLKEQKRLDRVIIISSHNINLIRDWCEEVFIINNGQIMSRFDENEMRLLKDEPDDFKEKYISLINES